MKELEEEHLNLYLLFTEYYWVSQISEDGRVM
jgi:hypothetical protein